MKIAGKVPGVNRGFVEIHRPGGAPFRLAVQAVPYGFSEKISNDLPLPDPPTDYVKDARGGVRRDENGMAIKEERRTDRKWRAETRRVRALRILLHVREALRGDPEIVFDADARDKKLEGRAYAEAVEKEFREAGFADEEILKIFEKSLALAQGAEDRVKEIAENFLAGGPSAPAGGSAPAPGAQPST